MWTNTSPSNPGRGLRGSLDDPKDLGETFDDAWTSRTDGCTKEQEEEADKEELHEDDQGQERDKKTSRSGPRMGHP